MSDHVLAAAIRGIVHRYQYSFTTNLTGQRTDHVGAALYLVILNKTHKRIDDLSVGTDGYLIDDRGHQYTPTDSRFWWSDESGDWHEHSDSLAPNAKMDGFVLYPQLRKASTGFVRWYFAKSFRVGGEFVDGEYNVELA